MMGRQAWHEAAKIQACEATVEFCKELASDVLKINGFSGTFGLLAEETETGLQWEIIQHSQPTFKESNTNVHDAKLYHCRAYLELFFEPSQNSCDPECLKS